MQNKKIVLDTNVLISSLSRRGKYFPIWQGFQEGSENVELIQPYFHLGLITADPDDNKFVDCAFAANATYIVSNDSHFDVLQSVDFPILLVLKLKEFLEKIQNNSL